MEKIKTSNRVSMTNLQKKLMLSWMPGTGGDMVKSCLYLLLFDGDWEYKFYTGDEWVMSTPVEQLLKDRRVLHWNDKIVSFIGNVGECITPTEWKSVGILLEDRPDVVDIVYSIRKEHHTETNTKTNNEILRKIEEACNVIDINPIVTFICMKDNKYLDIAKKNWISKMVGKNFEGSITQSDIQMWINDIDADIKFRKENPDKANNIFHELDSKIHMMYMDNFYEWKTFKQELEDYLKCYDIAGHKENFPIVKQFWQAWINEQVL